MKKLAVFLGIILAIGVVLAVLYRIVNTVPEEGIEAHTQASQILDEASCISCHSKNPKLPFYSSFPIAGNIVKDDAAKGFREFDMEDILNKIKNGEQINEVALNKIEYTAITEGTMPPAKYYLVHWGSSLTDAKKKMLQNWINAHRDRFYENALASADFKHEPVRPVPNAVKYNENKAALGEKLYYDTRLSSDNTVSCSSCHGLETGGVDNKQYSEGVDGQLGGVNAPTVFNAYFNFVQFWDGRAADLAEQAAGPPVNPIEMACKSFDEIVEKLKNDDTMKEVFEKLYPNEGITEKTITNAIAEYEKTFITPNCRFDKYLKGDENAINDTERNGYELFKSNECATCHAGVILGGQTYELMGIRNDYFADRGWELTEEDKGRFKQTTDEYYNHRFKVPGLRNVALTKPYFHDGSQQNLSDAVKKMGLYQSDIQLSDDDTNAIVAFLETLTGEYKGKTLTNNNK